MSVLKEKLGAAAQVGLDGIELFGNNLIGYPDTAVPMAAPYRQLVPAGVIG